ncbi:MAG: (2Fe-2S)-binding protein [Gammaproteobacteria bacterium]|nr:MAG: (2Fe-2S)-binding protein [Gammaproteobacteria bacterium]
MNTSNGAVIASSSSNVPDVADLVFDDRVHSRIFTDPEIFNLEIERIFKRTWQFALHESEIPNAGDFKTFELALEPVIAVRGKDDSIKILVNRCRHRGMQVCEQRSGNASRFQCWYHGWNYALDGSLLSEVDQATGMTQDDLGLGQLPRVDNYRGFVFASFAESGPSLEEHLGETRRFFDIMLDYSPTGRVRVDPKVVHRVKYDGNWKQVGMDGYHVHFVHRSVVDIFSSRKEGTTGSAVGALHMEDPWSDASSSRARGFPYGHAALDLLEQRMAHADDYLEEVENSPGGHIYLEKMTAIHGRDKAKEMIAMHGDPHLGVFPNLQLIHDHLRVVVPISASHTEVHMYPIMLEDVPAEFNTARLRHHEDFYGPASFGSPDDAEIFERTQNGLMAEVDPWIMVNRGLGGEGEQHESDGTTTGNISAEVTQRAQFAEWRRLMLQH